MLFCQVLWYKLCCVNKLNWNWTLKLTTAYVQIKHAKKGEDEVTTRKSSLIHFYSAILICYIPHMSLTLFCLLVWCLTLTIVGYHLSSARLCVFCCYIISRLLGGVFCWSLCTAVVQLYCTTEVQTCFFYKRVMQ